MATNPTLERLNKTKGNSGTIRAATSTESTTVNPTIARLNGQMNKTVQQESKTKTNETPSAQNNTVTEEKTTLGDRLLDMLRSTWNTAAGATKASAAMSLNTAKDLDDAVNNQKIATKNAASRVDLYQSMADNATSADDKKRYQMMADNAKRAAGIIADENSAYNSHPLNNAIEKTTTSALSNYQKSNEYAESAREGLGKVGSTIVDAVQTTANMAAPIAVGALTGGVGGAIATGVQSGGNAYLEKLASGSNEKQARAYGSIIGLLESATSALIGGIAKTGGKLIGSSPIEAKISAMDAGLKKGAAYLAYHNAAEINEEEVQLFLEPLVNKIIYGGDYDAPTIEDIVYTAIVTGLSTSALNARPAIKTGRTQANTASDNSITQAFSDTQINTQNESNLTVENNTAQNAVKSVTEEQPKQVTPQTIFEIIDKSKNGRADLNKVDANSLDMKSVETSMTSGEVAMDSDGKLYRVNPSEHIDNRQYGTVSERSLNAFQFDHPDLHNYYAETAKALYDDLQNSERGGETVKIPAGRAIGDDEYIRTSRAATAEVAELLDDANLSYNDIAKALDAIINNHGQENYAAAKKVEVMLDKMLTNGYRTSYGEDVAPNAAYIQAKSEIVGSQDNGTTARETKKESGYNGLGNADAGTLNTDFQNMQAATDEFHPINEHAAQRTAAEQMRAPSDVPVVNPITEQNISKVASTIINSPITSNDMAPILEQAVADGKFDYAPITDKDANTKAQKTISDMGGYKAAANQFIARAEFGKADKNDFALGIACYNESVSAGDNVTAFELASAIGNVAHNSAQVVQAMNIFNRLTPAGKLLTLKNYINKVNRKSESKPKKSKGAKQHVDNIDALETGRPDLAINLDEDLAAAYLMAETDADRAAAWQDIVDDIASKMPATVSEKWNTWRYTSMLFNPVTVIRNTAGNAVQQGLRNTKNAVGVLMEKSINKADRTKAILTNSEADKALKSLGQEMFVSDKELAMGTGKYSEGTSQGIARDIQEARGKQVFGNSNKAVIKQVGKAAQAMNNATQWMLNNEYFGDLAFSKATYVDSFAQALKAKGITYEMAMDGKHNAQVESARAYAIDEAAKATYRDSNAFSDFVSSIAKSDYKAVNAFVDAILPYRRTPANILVRGTVDYSPIGIAKALTYDIKQMKSGNATAADVVDHLASGLTGTGILALGAYLASQGLIHIKAGDDEKEQNFLKASGYQDFALQIGDTSYTIDWLVPAAMPLFAGVAMFNGVKDNGGGLEDFLSAMTGITDVILETSMLQSINSVIENMSYAEQKVWYVLSSAITSYLGQALPTIGGKVASATDDTVRKAFVQSGKSEVEQDIDYFAQSVMRKIPGARQQMQPSIDLWGREVSNGSVAERIAEAFVSPGFISKADNSKVNKELSRLAETQGSDVYPTKVEKSFKVNGETKNLTADEYTEYAKSVGKKRYEIINELTNDSGYNKLSDENKASVISDVYELATALAKKEIDSNYKLNDEVQKAVDSGLNPSQYFIYKINRDKDGSKTVSMVEAGQTLEGMSGITDKQKGKAWQNQNAQWSEAKNPFTGTLAKAGVDPATSIAIMNKYNEIDSAGGKAKDNSYAFESYLNTLHLTSAQKSAAQNLFKFYTHIPYTKNIK